MKDSIATEKAPAAIGPYAQGRIASGRIAFISGQLPVDAGTGEMPGTIEEQTRMSLTNVKAIVEEAGADMGKVVKTTVYLQSMKDFSAMNGIYKTFFPEGKFPARSAIEVGKLPKDALVEIEAIVELN